MKQRAITMQKLIPCLFFKKTLGLILTTEQLFRIVRNLSLVLHKVRLKKNFVETISRSEVLNDCNFKFVD